MDVYALAVRFNRLPSEIRAMSLDDYDYLVHVLAKIKELDK